MQAAPGPVYLLHRQPSPMSSTNATPSNSTPVSPTSNNSHHLQSAVHFQSRQLRPPKAPLYVPAVLRRTERPAKQSPAPSPITPPRSVHGSLDAAVESPAGGPGAAAAAAGGQGGQGGPGDPDSTPPALSRRTTVDSNQSEVSKLAEDEWLRAQDLGEIAGLPSKDHWKADAASPSCDSPVCKSFFGLFLRRHHCRHCGHVFCSSHTPHLVRLDHNARFHPDGVPSRACDLCWQAFRMWEDDRAQRLSQIERDLFARLEERREQGGGVNDLSSLPATAPQSARPGGNGSNMLSPDQPPDEMVASSVPRDWSWSTF